MKSDMKICVIMLGLFGDVLARTPILQSLKERYPNSAITAIADPIGKEILENNPYVDEIFSINRKRDSLFNYILEKIKTQFKIIAKRFDLIIDLYNSSSSRTMTNLSFAKRKIKNKANTDIYKFKNKFHMTNYLYEMISDIKFTNLNTMPQYYLAENHTERERESKSSYLISLGSGDLRKILSFDKTYKLIKYIYENYGLIPTIVQNPGQEFLQQDLIDSFLAPNNIPYIALNKKSVDELANLLKNTKFIIVPDTGLLHLSFAMRTPAFCVFTHTNPVYVLPEDKDYIFGYSYKIKIPKEYDLNKILNCTKDIEFNIIKNDFNKFYENFKTQNQI